MSKNKNSEIISALVSGLSTAWSTYKRTSARRHQPPMESFINDLLGIEMTDVEAAKYLAQDVAEVQNILRTKKTEKTFNNIIKDSF